MPYTVLYANPWDDYDRRKTDAGENRDHFCPDEPWELNYLVKKVQHHYPSYTDVSISLAIRQAVKTTIPPRQRVEFVSIVMKCVFERKPFILN